jgi:stringent starvation protein B
MSDIIMKPNRPYIFRALYNWIVDSGLTPYILVQADLPFVLVPKNYISQGRIVLNISPESVMHYSVDDEALSFRARFSGKEEKIYVPFYSLNAIYAKENGAGSEFAPDLIYQEQIKSLNKSQSALNNENNHATQSQEKEKKRPSYIKVIK